MSGLFRRKGSPYWYCWYKDGNKIKKVSTKKTLKKDSKEVLFNLEKSVREHSHLTNNPDYKDVRLSHILQLFVDDYEIKGKKNPQEYNKRVRYTDMWIKYFSQFDDDIPVINITHEMTEGYKKWRKTKNYRGLVNEDNIDNDGKEVQPSTINRELSCLRRSFQLGYENNLVLTIPLIKKLEEDNVRDGVFTIGEIQKLIEHLPEYLKLPVWFGYLSCWRKEEIFGMLWKQVNKTMESVYIGTSKTKNRQGKGYYFDDDTKEWFERHYLKMKSVGKVAPNDYVFQNRTNTGRVKDFRYIWKKTLKKVGQPEDRIFHDLRRSGIINMVNSGVPYQVVMTVSGHKTRSVFDRYFITSEEQLRGVSNKVSEYLKGKKELEKEEREKLNKELEKVLPTNLWVN